MGSLNGFYQVVHRLARTPALAGWSVVGDLPAGPRQAAFAWAPYARGFLLVVEPTWQSILTARRIARIVRSRPGVQVFAVGNKIAEPHEAELIAERLGEKIIEVIPADRDLADAERKGIAVIDHAPGSAAVRAIERLVKKLARRSLDP
ncbi:MAG: hypothetical protein ABR575_01220 [Actinomycetota bacterium]